MRYPEKIISGGQTGADQGGLEAAKELGLQTGGQVPLGWRTEDGPQETLLLSYGLIQHWSSGYPPRTKANIHNSDGTVIFGKITESGSRLTYNLCKEGKKPCLVNPETPSQLLAFIQSHTIRILNVAGNRESKNPGIQERVRTFIVEALREEVKR